MKNLLLHLIAFRICSVFLVKSSFVPDEYWQALEVAHHSAFGYGDLTWEWSYGLRSCLYPMLFSLVYRLLALFGLDYTTILVYSPRIIQAIFSGLGDWYYYRFVKEHFSAATAKFSLFFLLCNWFWWYCASRTIINSVECAALCIGLFYYPWTVKQGTENRTMYFQIIAIIITIIRPTAAVVWVPLAMLHILRGSYMKTFIRYTNLGVLILTLSSLVDFVFYQRFVIVLWNFLNFNIVKNLGVHYGSHPWHWYFTQGVPAIFGSQLPIVIYGTLSSKTLSKSQIKVCNHFLLIAVTTCLAYSFIAHKEFRFILHLIPVGSLFGGFVMSNLAQTKRRSIMSYVLLTNIPIAMYTGLIHQAAPLKIMEDLGSQLQSSCVEDCPGQVLFLMPCHTTPLYSHMHVNVSVRYIECLPNLHEKRDYHDDNDVFYAHPTAWLDKHVFRTGLSGNKGYQWVLIFDSLLFRLKDYGPLKDYRVCGKAFHTHFPESRTGSYIYLLCKIESGS